MNDEIAELWVDKWQPKVFEDLVLEESQKDYFKSLVESKNIVHMLLAGSPGIGKTTIAKLIAKLTNAVTLFVPCSIDGNVSTAQGSLKDFCDSVTLDNRPKIIILDELDSASGTQDNSFQKVLRNLIEDSQTDCRFIATANFPEKIIAPLKSRCIPINLTFSAKDLLKRIKVILDTEKINYTLESLKAFVEIAIKQFYPDIRKIISHLQTCCSTGTLVVSSNKTVLADHDNFIADLINKLKNENLLSTRKFYIQNTDQFGNDYIVFASDIFNYCLDNGLIKKTSDILQITNIIYQLNIVVDKEIQFFSLITYIKEING